jgi:hypothetical protein
LKIRVQNKGVKLKKFQLLVYSEFHDLLLFFLVILYEFQAMEEAINIRTKQDKLIRIGERVCIDDQEWKIAEIKNDSITLYRDGVDGKSNTTRQTVEQVKTLLHP